MSQAENPRVNPAALTVDEAAALMRVETSRVREHIAAGLPVDERGRINLIEYTAWMLQKIAEANGMTSAVRMIEQKFFNGKPTQ